MRFAIHFIRLLIIGALAAALSLVIGAVFTGNGLEIVGAIFMWPYLLVKQLAKLLPQSPSVCGDNVFPCGKFYAGFAVSTAEYCAVAYFAPYAWRRCQPFTAKVASLVPEAFSLRAVIATALFALWGGYTIWTQIENRIWFWVPFGVAALIAATGLIPRWRWTRWFAYVVVVVNIGTLLYGLFISLYTHRFPYEGIEITAIELVPGFVFLAASLWCGDIVRRRLGDAPSSIG